MARSHAVGLLALLLLAAAASAAPDAAPDCAAAASSAAAWDCLQASRATRLVGLLALLAGGTEGLAPWAAARARHAAADAAVMAAAAAATAGSSQPPPGLAAVQRRLLDGGSAASLALSREASAKLIAAGGGTRAAISDATSVTLPLDEPAAARVAARLAGGGSRAASAPEAVVAAAAGPQQQAEQPSPRIVGGELAPTDRKYVCSLRTSKDSHFCGCSLVAPSVVLTAAHCLEGPEGTTPIVEIGRYWQQRPKDTGVNNFERLRCAAGLQHPGWTGTSGAAANDLALCFLDSPSRFSPVRLAGADTRLAQGQRLTVMGWGSEEEGSPNAPALMAVDVVVSPQDACNRTYNGNIRGSQICAGLPEGGADACQGDSGGPLVIKGAASAQDVQVGVVSFGIGCGRPAVPGVYTRVSDFRNFIAQEMLARGVRYAPLTDGDAATKAPGGGAAAAAQAPPVAMSEGAAPAPQPVSAAGTSLLTGGLLSSWLDAWLGDAGSGAAAGR